MCGNVIAGEVAKFSCSNQEIERTMKPSEIGLVVFRRDHRNENGDWIPDGFTLVDSQNADPEKERSEPTGDISEGVGGLAVYLFGSEIQRNAFITGLYSAGDSLDGWAKGQTNLGCPGLIKEFGSRESFVACTRTEDPSHIVVFDYREHGDVDSLIPDQIVSIFHRESKTYGGSMTASPEFMLCLVDQRAEKGEVGVGVWPAKDATGENQIMVSVCVDTLLGGARSVPHVQVHHHTNHRRLFRLYKHSPLEHLLVPDKSVKFKPHLMPNGTMGFVVSDEIL